jgi:hypothetical protein
MVSGIFGSLLSSEIECIVDVVFASLVSAVLMSPLPPVVYIVIVVCVTEMFWLPFTRSKLFCH